MFGVECHKQKLYMAKRIAFASLSGEHANSYPKLQKYASILKIVNPGIVALI